jgi:LEA14-like dessication related protein
MVPKLPQILNITGITGQFASGVIQPLEVGEPSLEDIDIGAQGLIFVFKIPVENPNPYPANLDRISYKAYINGEKITEGSMQESTVIPAKGKRQIRDRVNADITGFAIGGVDVLSNKLKGEKSHLEIEGQLHFGSGPITLDVPFKKRSALN